MKVNELVQFYLETKDEQYFKELIDIFEPLILSYAHRLYYLEKDDSVQELTLALFESISTIHDTSDTAMCFSYIQSAIYHRFCKLYYKSKTAKEQIDRHVYIENMEALGQRSNDIDDCLFRLDLDKILKKMDPKRKQIILLLIQGWSDAEIANIQGYSKQYINRIKKNLLKNT